MRGAKTSARRRRVAALAATLAVIAGTAWAKAATELSPYYATPPGDALVLEQCGPESDWEKVDVTSAADVEGLRKSLRRSKKVVLRIHWSAAPYPVFRVKGIDCLKIVGLPGPGGEKPLLAGINAARAYRDAIRPGGLIVENVEVSPGKAMGIAPDLKVRNGDCISPSSDQMFFILRDVVATRCGHHAFLTSHSHQMYVEVGRSHFARAGSHLAYIDHVAMGYVYDSTFESPGWGHALRCVALRCVIERVEVSNVQLDGTTLPDGGDSPLEEKRRYIGMAPLEIYTCGEHHVKDVRAVFRSHGKINAGFAAILRSRDDLAGCDVGEVVSGEWTPLRPGEPEFLDPARWATVTPLATRVENMTVECVGDAPCWGWSVRGNYPEMRDDDKRALKKWLRASAFPTWESFLAAIPEDEPEWRFLASVTLPRFRDEVLAGRITNTVPLPVPRPGWFQRNRVEFIETHVRGGELLKPGKNVRSYCFGEPPVTDGERGVCRDQFDGAHYREAFVTVAGGASSQ